MLVFYQLEPAVRSNGPTLSTVACHGNLGNETDWSALIIEMRNRVRETQITFGEKSTAQRHSASHPNAKYELNVSF